LENYTILGTDFYTEKEVTVSDRTRQASCYVIGKPGTGKSSLLEQLIYQDCKKGEAVIVIDPASDLIRNVIAQLPEERIKDTFLLDITDVEHPFSLNIFSVTDAERLPIEKRRMAVSRVLHAFLMLFPSESRMLLQNMLNAITHTFFDNPGSSLADVYTLLYDDAVRRRMIRRLTNWDVKQWWEREYNAKSEAKRNTMIAPLTNRVPSLLTDPILKNITCQKTSSLDIRRSIERREILFITLPLQEYGEVAAIIGTMLIAEIHKATFSFSDTEISKRPGFSVFVDEFQNFTTRDFEILITQGRKYGIKATFAHQYRDQLLMENRNASIAASMLVAFQLTHPDARELSSSFVDQHAHIQEKTIYPDVLKHISVYHPSEVVAAFVKEYLNPLQQKAKEPIGKLPRSLTGIATIGDALKLLERLMYVVQKEQGVFFGEDDPRRNPATEKLYFDCVGVLAAYYGCYYLWKQWEKERVVEQNQQKIKAFEKELADKTAVLASDRAFLAYFEKGGYNEDWHKQERIREKERRTLKRELEHLLLLNREPLKEVASALGVPEITWDCTQTPDWPLLDAAWNRSLLPYCSVSGLLSMRRAHLEWLLRESLARKKRCQEEEASLLRKLQAPSRWFLTEGERYAIGYKSRDAYYRAGCADSESSTFRRTLEDKYCEGKKDAENIVSLCAGYTWLDSPEKLLAHKKKLYGDALVAPLIARITEVRETFRKQEEILDAQIEQQKKRYDALSDSLHLCLLGLIDEPLCENKPITSSDVALILEHLPARQALVRTGKKNQADNSEPGVFLISTIDTPPHTEKDEFDKRMEDIRERTRKTYCRPRSEVEAELHTKEEVDTEEENDLSEDEPFQRFEDE